MSEKQIHDGKIAFDNDGDGFWQANLDLGDGKEMILGRILIGVIIENEEIRKGFIDLMRKTLEHLVTFADPEAELVFSKLEKAPITNQ